MNKFVAILPFFALAAASSASLVTNGAFEADPYPYPYLSVTSVTGWTVVGPEVAGIKVPYLGAPNQEIDLSGVTDTTPGTTGLEQTISTIVGAHYSISFDVFAGSAFTTYNGGVDFILNGVTIGSNLQGDRATFTYAFIGTGSDTIRFMSNNGNVSHIDNVRATAVPGPAAMAAFALGALGARRRRK